jgi:hypothetical protein
VTKVEDNNNNNNNTCFFGLFGIAIVLFIILVLFFAYVELRCNTIESKQQEYNIKLKNGLETIMDEDEVSQIIYKHCNMK